MNLYLVNSETMSISSSVHFAELHPVGVSRTMPSAVCTVPFTPIIFYRQKIKIQGVLQKSFPSS